MAKDRQKPAKERRPAAASAAKRPTLLDEVESIQGMMGRRGTLCWDQQLRLKNPALMAEVDALIDRFLDGHLDHKFAGTLTLGRFLSPKVGGTSSDAIARYIDRRRANREAK